MLTRTPMTPRRYAVGLAGLALSAGLAWLAFLAVVTPIVLGWESVVVTSGSMQPALHRGDVVLAEPHDGDALGTGTVVVFRQGSKGLVTHRIVRRAEDGTYETRGDANAVADSTPVRPEQVEATGRIVVPRIGLVTVLAREGRWPEVGLLTALVALAAVAGRWGLTGRPVSNRPAGAPRAGHPRVRVVGALAAVQLALGLAALPTARAAWVSPTSNGVSTLQSATSWQQQYLNTPVEGASATSSPYLTIGTAKPTFSGALPNYDTDRNADPGLTLVPSTLGLAETDTTKYQIWNVPASPGAFNVNASVRLRLPAAVRGFNPTARGRMTAGLYVCDDPPVSCTLVKTATVDRPAGWSGTLTTFTETMFDFGAVSVHVPASRGLAVKVVVDAAGSDDSMWLAYDTVAYPAALQLT